MLSFTRRESAPVVHVFAGEFGLLTKPRHQPVSRIWALLNEEGMPFARVAWNKPNGLVAWEDLGLIKSLSLSRSHFSTLLTDRSALGPLLPDYLSGSLPLDDLLEAAPVTGHADLVIAPCVCGAGPVGLAGPSADRHHAEWLRNDNRAWLRVRT